MYWIFVFVGGGLGSLVRWGVFRLMNRTYPSVPPMISTFIVNAIGCLMIGYLFAMAMSKSSAENFRLFWLVGFLGGLTTFSTLGLDIFQLIQQKTFLYASLYFLFHGLVCISFVYLGNWMYSLR